MSRHAGNPIHGCPVPNCPWKPPQTTNTTKNNNEHILQLKQHLIQAHPDTPLTDHMDEDFFRKHNNMHVCLQCNKPSAIYTSAAHLRKHRENKHTWTDNNLDIVLKTYRHASEQVKTNWKQGLAFLHRLQPSPPPFCRSTWHRLKQPQRKEYFVTYNNVTTWILEATTPLGESTIRDTQPHPSLTDSAPFWKLLLLLEPLLLGPIQHTQHRKHTPPSENESTF